jgi:hypothetical protein
MVAISSNIHWGSTYFEREGHTKRFVMNAGSSVYLAVEGKERFNATVMGRIYLIKLLTVV